VNATLTVLLVNIMDEYGLVCCSSADNLSGLVEQVTLSDFV